MDLTDRPADAAAPHQLPPQERAGEDLLARALRRARWTIFWERLWPALASLATVIGPILEHRVSRRDVLGPPNFERRYLQSQTSRRHPDLAHLLHGTGGAAVGHHRQSAERRQHLTQ